VLYNPPPDTCDHCRQRTVPWRLVDGPDQKVLLSGGREVIRRGRVYVCGQCGHTVPTSSQGVG
jgi:rubrerythrin